MAPILRLLRLEDNRGWPWHDKRAVLHGVFWVLGTGAHWSELPAKYTPYQTCHRGFQRKSLAPLSITHKSGSDHDAELDVSESG